MYVFFHLFCLAIEGPFALKPQTVFSSEEFSYSNFSMTSHLAPSETVVACESWSLQTFPMSAVFLVIIFLSFFLTLGY